MKKKPRAEFDYRFDKNNEIMLVRWKDNNICTIATNHDSHEPLGTVKRWYTEKKEKVDVHISHAFQNYNKSMGGVDELEQSISLYRISIHDGVEHVPEKLPTRVRCFICHIRGRWGCKKCKKTLCIEKSYFANFYS
ncbi:unnamed protein product [Euphydryas editha]|nr:unnamed protein product [Euphydryas editha]